MGQVVLLALLLGGELRVLEEPMVAEGLEQLMVLAVVLMALNILAALVA